MRFYLVMLLIFCGGFSHAAQSPAPIDSSKTDRALKTVLFFGNSLTAGYNLNKEQAFPALIQQKIDSLSWPFTAINAGLSGETSAGGLRRIGWLLRRPVDVFVLELGANDALRGIDLAVTEANLQAIIDRVRSANPQVRIVIAGMQAPPNLGDRYTARFQSLFVDLARKNKAALIPFLLAGVAGNPELNLPDGIHPTAAGQHIVTANIWKILAPLLREMAAEMAGG